MPSIRLKTQAGEPLPTTNLASVYGDMNAIIQLFNLIGITEVSKIFFSSISLSSRRKGNYHELTINYFTLVFNKYAH